MPIHSFISNGGQLTISEEKVRRLGELLLIQGLNSMEVIWIGLVMAAEMHRTTIVLPEVDIAADLIDLATQAAKQAQGATFAHLVPTKGTPQ
jgi:hypothetical protein